MMIMSILFAILSAKGQHRHHVIDSDDEGGGQNDEIYSQKAAANLQKLFNSQPPENTEVGCQGTVLIMPHCETSIFTDNGQGMHEDECNLLGFERAFYLITQFGNGPNERWPVPYDIFAMGDRFKIKRAIQTLQPLQLYYKIRGRDEPASYSSRKKLVHHIRTLVTSGELCGRVIIVTTAFVNDIPWLASDLGCGPMNSGCPTSFDQNDRDHVWELKFLYDKVDDNDAADDNNSTVTNTMSSTQDDKPRWQLFGNVVEENFDPLAFSKLVGDYGPGATQDYPRWMNMSTYDELGLGAAS